MEQQRPAAFQFGAFQLDVPNGELRKHGIKIKLQEQPLQILVLLLEHPSEVVTREQIQHKLWPPDTYVDYDNAINSAMRKLREALGDDSEHPQFIETMARRGYRFIGHIEAPHRIEETPAPVPPEPSAPNIVPRRSRTALVAALCGAALLLAAVAGWWLLRPRVETVATDAALVPAPLTAAEGLEHRPNLSPDGNQVAYVWGEKATSIPHVFVKLIGQGKPVQLTSSPSQDSCPTWSPDGRTIAFIRFPDITKRFPRWIYTMPALGGAERRVAEGSYGCMLSWSPDGRFLAADERDSKTGPWFVVRVDVENGEELALTKVPDARTEDFDAAFSRDGRTLLFKRCSGSFHCGLYLLELSADYLPAGEPRLLRQERGVINGVAWTADGREIVYALSEDAGLNYHLIRILAEAGAQPQRLTFAGEHADQPAVSAHGNRLVYRQIFSDADIWQVHPGGPPTKFISSTRWEDSAQFSPNGLRVAFASNRTGLMQVWVCDADGGNQVQLTRFDQGHSGTPRWSPDGRWIAFDHQEKEGWRIYVMAADGGQVRRLAEDKGDAVIPSWSGDGKWIYYASNGGGRYEVWKRPAHGGEGMQLTHNGGWVAFESRDGHSLYYDKIDAPGVWVLPHEGRQEKQILPSATARAFAIVDDGIYYIPEAAPDGTSSLRFHSLVTGKETEIAPIRYPWSVISVSPDRRTILFTLRAQSESGNVMVVDNFR